MSQIAANISRISACGRRRRHRNQLQAHISFQLQDRTNYYRLTMQKRVFEHSLALSWAW